MATTELKMFRYKFTDGSEMLTHLDIETVVERSRRLDTLRVLTEGYDDGVGWSINHQARKAYYNLNGFTGIIRLSQMEKNFLLAIKENRQTLNPDQIDAINYYTQSGIYAKKGA